MSDIDGPWVIVEFNQASGMPGLANTEVYSRYVDAETDAHGYRQEATKVGRREVYLVAEIDLCDEGPS